MNTDWPAARHSHAMVATESQLFIFGGCGTDKVLGELFSFDVRTHRWQKEQINGKVPRARFSHLMFVYKHFIGIMGGCPVNKACKEIALTDLKLRAWKHMPLNSAGKDLLVRSTANVVDDSLVIVGGGAACYAFGTKFSEPLTINLLPFISATGVISRNEKAQNCDVEKPYVSRSSDVPSNDSAEAVPQSHESSIESETGISHSFVLLERDFAKVGKDLLKNMDDLTRKAYSREDGKHIRFPVTNKFCSLLHAEKSLEKTARLSSDPLPTLCKLGATIIMNDAGEFRKPSHPPVKIMREAVASLLKRQDMPEDLLEELPARWERLGDIVVLPESSFKNKMWDSLGNELWSTVAKSLGACQLAQQGRVASTGTRDSTLEILVGENGWVEHRENGIVYSFDATKCMFSWVNLSEKLRMAGMNCRDEVVVDLFAGIGYFVLPFLVRANAKLVYACEWNPNAIEALRLQP
uniref:tRNA(Phe) (4-demethylwyosine(37)-C(7)) aminocarboxypropyltransferase n=1 Tax=Kalanchoe fedtschenkoi TaxID=63787 RepID=A0A7N1A2L6_KALFE